MSSSQTFAEFVLLSALELLPVGCPGRSPSPAPARADPACLFSTCHSSPCALLISPHCPFLLLCLSLTPRPPSLSGALAVLPGPPAVSIFWLLQTTLISPLSGCLLASCPLPHTWALQISLQLPKCLFPLSNRVVNIFRAEKAFQSPERSTTCTQIHIGAHRCTDTFTRIHIHAPTYAHTDIIQRHTHTHTYTHVSVDCLKTYNTSVTTENHFNVVLKTYLKHTKKFGFLKKKK